MRYTKIENYLDDKVNMPAARFSDVSHGQSHHSMVRLTMIHTSLKACSTYDLQI